MTETEKKALALVKAHGGQYGLALEAAIEQHEAFKLEVSDAVEAVRNLWGARHWPSNDKFEALSRFIIAKPDPLEEVLEMMGWTYDGMVRRTTALRNALAARGLEVRKIGEGE